MYMLVPRIVHNVTRRIFPPAVYQCKYGSLVPQNDKIFFTFVPGLSVYKQQEGLLFNNSRK